MAVKAITPKQAFKKAVEVKINSIPDFVYEIVNQYLLEQLGAGKVAVLYQREVIKRIIIEKECTSDKLARETIFGQKWLDFEYLYRKAGWNVVYDNNMEGNESWTFREQV